jgi:hypothetical protein
MVAMADCNLSAHNFIWSLALPPRRYLRSRMSYLCKSLSSSQKLCTFSVVLIRFNLWKWHAYVIPLVQTIAILMEVSPHTILRYFNSGLNKSIISNKSGPGYADLSAKAYFLLSFQALYCGIFA